MKLPCCCKTFSGKNEPSNDNKFRTTVADIFLGGAINRTRQTVGQNTGLDIFQLGIMNPFVKTRNRGRLSWFNFLIFIWFDIEMSVPLWQRMSENKKEKKCHFFYSS